ncbi:Beta-fructosidase [compost metagenome]
MVERLKYHFEPQTGWINDPNGLIFYKGRYHAFFQHYPFAPRWGQMHWGHAVSDDLVHWEELPIALYPDQEYEDSTQGGCFSGCAVIKDDILYLIYTSVSDQFGQTQSVAMSHDGVNFEKYSENPVIRQIPSEASFDFRDPKVTLIDGIYYMVLASGKDDIGKILLYKSLDLLDWDYVGVLFEGAEYGGILECPDFFPFAGEYLLMFSQIGCDTRSTIFAYGDFDGKKLTDFTIHTPHIGPHYYAPQTFLDEQGRRILIGWLFNKDEKLNGGADYAGALTIPCELSINRGKLLAYPVVEAQDLLSTSDELVVVENHKVWIKADNVSFPIEYNGGINSIKILRDTKTIEVFINEGEAVFTYWYAN